jgi:hypothetical protein
LSYSHDGDHEVSILMTTVVGDGRLLAAGREDLDDAHAATEAWTRRELSAGKARERRPGRCDVTRTAHFDMMGDGLSDLIGEPPFLT